MVFLAIHVVMRPFVSVGAREGIDWWAVNAAVLLGVLGSGGGLLNARQIRALRHDDVSRAHARTSMVAGYWVAMAVAMAVYLLPVGHVQTAREGVYVIVTASLVTALLAFSYFEFRAR